MCGDVQPTYYPMLQDGKKIPWWKLSPCCGVFLQFGNKYTLSVPLILNPSTSHISPQFHVIFDDHILTVISQTESEEVPKEWNDLCITNCYQTFFDDHDPTRLNNEWLTTDELILQKHQDAQGMITLSTPDTNLILIKPSLPTLETNPLSHPTPLEHQRE